MKYDFKAIQQRWQNVWQETNTFAVPNPGDEGFDPARPKFFVLDMFPYPSGVGLHVGHPLGYIATDIVARYKRMRGFNVLHPMGYDAFGLPAEQFAVEHGVHPRITTEKNIANMTRQLKLLGLSYDWDRCIATTDVDYYKWTQWIFLKLYHSWFDPAQNAARPIKELEQRLVSEELYVSAIGEIIFSEAEGTDAVLGSPIGARKWHELNNDERRAVLDSQRLAFMDEVPVNWCPALGTVLANEEVTNDGRSERGNHPVFKRPLRQWMLRITSFAERLGDDLELVDWPEPIKMMQRNWIGRSEGASVEFHLTKDASEVIEVFTTRPDTLFGATYMVLAPEHPLVDDITTDEQRDVVNEYRRKAAAKSEDDRTAENSKAKTGVFTGAYATNPVNGRQIPIWIADYVLMTYGTGAIMAVPAHDERDHEFAKQFGLPIVDVVYTPVLRAISEGCSRFDADLPESEHDKAFTTLVDFVAYCISRDITDYEEAWVIVTNRRKVDGDGGPERGSVHAIWRDTLEPWIRHGVAALLRAGRKGGLIAMMDDALKEEGVSAHSSNDDISINGLPTNEAKQKITKWLESKGVGRFRVQYKLRDWLFSRQRYWGEPFPILHGPDGEVVPVDIDELPVELPPMENFQPEGSDDPNAPVRPPLGRAPESWRVVEKDGVRYERELNTMPQWAGSCWYYLRFIDPKNDGRFVGENAEKYWMVSKKASKSEPHAGGVDLYVGGAEHAVLHLLYARFWHKVLYDLGHVSTPEPFGRLFNQGYIQAYAYTDERGVYVDAAMVREIKPGEPMLKTRKKRRLSQDFMREHRAFGANDADIQEIEHETAFYIERDDQRVPVVQEFGKMGKSLRNAITPDEIANEYGADTLRLYEMYLGPLDQSKPWSTQDIIGVHRFLQRFWRNFINEETGALKIDDAPAAEAIKRSLHKTIKRVTEALDSMSVNVAIAALIELNNELVPLPNLPRDVAEPMILLLGPMAPHVCEELWHRLGHENTFAYESWPTFDEAMVQDAVVELPVQVNGKVRGRITIPADADDAAVEAAARADERVAEQIDGKTVRKVIVIKGRMINIVAN